jgi:hypothetical protein
MLLNCDFYIRLLLELTNVFQSSILKVIRLLYSILEVGNHWFYIYHYYHTDQLNMKTLSFNLCLLYCIKIDNSFGIVSMQTNDILLLTNSIFAVWK